MSTEAAPESAAPSPEEMAAQIAGDEAETGVARWSLSDDQRDIRDWVHGFAEDVVRPAASEWDEREETPWPIIQEAAKIGLYGFEALAQFYADPSGLTLPIVNEELFWGDAGIGMAIMGTSLAVAGHLRQRHPGADGRVGPAVLRHAGRARRSAPSASRSPTPAPTSPRCARAPLRRGQGRVGPQRPEGVGHERRHRQRARRRGLRRPRARLARPGRVRDPAGHQGPRDGHEGQEARPARLAHRRRLPRRLPHPGLVPARRQGEARRAAGARPRGHARQAPGGDADLRGHRARPSAPRRSGSPARPTSTRSSTPRSASSSAARSSRTRRSRSRWPT